MSPSIRTYLPSKASFTLLLLALVLFILAMTIGCTSYTDKNGVVHQQFDVGGAKKVLNDPGTKGVLDSIPFGLGSIVSGIGGLVLYGISQHQNKTRQVNSSTTRDIVTEGFKALGESLSKSTTALANSTPVPSGSSTASVGL